MEQIAEREEKECWWAWENKETENLVNKYIEAKVEKLNDKFSVDEMLELLSVIGKTVYHNFLFEMSYTNKSNLLSLLKSNGYNEIPNEDAYIEGHQDAWYYTKASIPKEIISLGKEATSRYIIENFMQQLMQRKIKDSIADIITDNVQTLDDENKSLVNRITAVLETIDEQVKSKEEEMKPKMKEYGIKIVPTSTYGGYPYTVKFNNSNGEEVKYEDEFVLVHNDGPKL